MKSDKPNERKIGRAVAQWKLMPILASPTSVETLPQKSIDTSEFLYIEQNMLDLHKIKAKSETKRSDWKNGGGGEGEPFNDVHITYKIVSGYHNLIPISNSLIVVQEFWQSLWIILVCI